MKEKTITLYHNLTKSEMIELKEKIKNENLQNGILAEEHYANNVDFCETGSPYLYCFQHAMIIKTKNWIETWNALYDMLMTNYISKNGVPEKLDVINVFCVDYNDKHIMPFKSIVTILSNGNLMQLNGEDAWINSRADAQLLYIED